MELYPEYYYDISKYEKDITNINNRLASSGKNLYDVLELYKTDNNVNVSVFKFHVKNDGDNVTELKNEIERVLGSIIDISNKAKLLSKKYEATKKIVKKSSTDNIDESYYGKPIKPYVIDCTFSVDDSVAYDLMVPNMDEDGSTPISSFFEPIIAKDWEQINYTNIVNLREDQTIKFAKSFSEVGRPGILISILDSQGKNVINSASIKKTGYYYKSSGNNTIKYNRYLIS